MPTNSTFLKLLPSGLRLSRYWSANTRTYAPYIKIYKICRICIKILKYADYDVHADFAGEELVNALKSPDVELLVNSVQHRTNNFVPHVVKPPAIDWLAGPNEVPAQAAVTNMCSGRAGRQATTHLACPLPATRSNAFLPLPVGGRAPSTRRKWAIA